MPALPPSERGHFGVIGLWHLGSVTAACIAQAGYHVVGVDPDPAVIEELSQGRPPVSEPGLAELIGECAEMLHFTTDQQALSQCTRAWVTFDTPVDEDDRADVEWVLEQASAALEALPSDALVLVSSQLPVGSVSALRARCTEGRGAADLRFACLPENLRLGQALDAFRSPDRIVVGTGSDGDRQELEELLEPFGGEREWMSIESAEMTKHAINGFLATSVAYINEIAGICEAVGADAAEVSRGLKSERRIGPRAYLSPGEAFAGGTLARDIGFLRELAEQHGRPANVFAGVAEGNDAHKSWAHRRLTELIGTGAEHTLTGATVAVWGLTYKPGTDTLRRSSAVELCHQLLDEGVAVQAHDPAVTRLPSELAGVTLCDSPLMAVTGARALVVCTPWPEYREVAPAELLLALADPLVLDAAGFLSEGLATLPGLRYVRVGSDDHPALYQPTEALRETGAPI
jgi:UDPglucose 6-dehydrogenase